jgi:hypothetical protein
MCISKGGIKKFKNVIFNITMKNIQGHIINTMTPRHDAGNARQAEVDNHLNSPKE